MPIIISPEKINDIAQEINMGMKAFYNIKTAEVKSYPDELEMGESFDNELWVDIIDEIEAAPNEYIAFEEMSSSESFELMESFVETIADAKTQNAFLQALRLKKPFQQFNDLIRDYPIVEKQWFEFKARCSFDHIQQQLNDYNDLNSDD